jgi:hypothetical protein
VHPCIATAQQRYNPDRLGTHTAVLAPGGAAVFGRPKTNAAAVEASAGEADCALVNAVSSDVRFAICSTKATFCLDSSSALAVSSLQRAAQLAALFSACANFSLKLAVFGKEGGDAAWTPRSVTVRSRSQCYARVAHRCMHGKRPALSDESAVAADLHRTACAVDAGGDCAEVVQLAPHAPYCGLVDRLTIGRGRGRGRASEGQREDGEPKADEGMESSSPRRCCLQPE